MENGGVTYQALTKIYYKNEIIAKLWFWHGNRKPFFFLIILSLHRTQFYIVYTIVSPRKKKWRLRYVFTLSPKDIGLGAPGLSVTTLGGVTTFQRLSGAPWTPMELSTKGVWKYLGDFKVFPTRAVCHNTEPSC